MTGPHGDERPPTAGAFDALCRQRRLDDGAVVRGFDHPRPEAKGPSARCRPAQPHGVVGGDRERRRGVTCAHHQVVRGRPVAVAVKEHADDTAVDKAGERLVVRLGRPVQDDLVALDATLDVQPLRVRRPAPETRRIGRVPILQALVGHTSVQVAPFFVDAFRFVFTGRRGGPFGLRRGGADSTQPPITTTTSPTLPIRSAHGAT